MVVATGASHRSGRGGPRQLTDGGDTIVDVIDVLAGDAAQPVDIVVIDELGFHQATSVAELLADRGGSVEIITKAMVVGQDLGITLDMETWWLRASAKGITQTTDRVAMGYENRALTLLHHPTGKNETRSPDWVVLAVPPTPSDGSVLRPQAPPAANGAPYLVERVGDCLAPRRAHSAVIEGRRIADQLSTQLASSAGSRGAVIGLIPVRDGVLPLGAREVAAEALGSVWLIGSGCRGGRDRSHRSRSRASCV